MSAAMSFGDVYGTLLTWLLTSPVEHNERTGKAIHVGRGGTSFRLDLSDGILPTCGLRRTYPRTAAAETAWYINGERDLAWLRKYAPIWDKFAEPMERLREGHEIERYEGIRAAYGYRWRDHFGRDQLGACINQLKRDPSDRRCFVSAWDPALDGCGEVGQRNVPCPVSFSLSITAGELHSTMTLRSSDVFVGLPYDVMGHALLMDAIAAQLGVKLGVATFALAHAHIYDVHWRMAEEAIDLAKSAYMPSMPMPGWALRSIELGPDEYVEHVTALAKDCTWPTYSPRPEVVL